MHCEAKCVVVETAKPPTHLGIGSLLSGDLLNVQLVWKNWLLETVGIQPAEAAGEPKPGETLRVSVVVSLDYFSLFENLFSLS